MAVHKILLKPEDNPDYHNIGLEYNKLMHKWKECNSKIFSLRIPRLLIFGTKKRLKEIGKEAQELQREYLVWNNLASNFAIAPKYKFDSEQNQELSYIHFTDNLRHLINGMRDYMIVLETNYKRRHSEYETQLNFLIAISAFSVGIIGLLLSAYGLFVQLNIL